MCRLPGHGAQRATGDDEQAAEEQRCQDDDGPALRGQAAQRLADDGAQPTAGAAERVETAHDLLRAAHDVQQPQDGQRSEPPTDAQPEAMAAAPLAHECDAHTHQRDGNDEAAEPGEPPDHGLDPATQRAGEVEVDAQAQQRADQDEADADELVFATGDRLAHLGRCLRAARHGHRCLALRGRGARAGGASTRRRATRRHGRLRSLVGRPPGRHRLHGTKGARDSTRTNGVTVALS